MATSLSSAALSSTVGASRSLATQHRATYRFLLRAASQTFHQDPINRHKFQSLVRSTFNSPTLDSDFVQYKKKVKVVQRCSDVPSGEEAAAETLETSTPETVPTSVTEQEYLERLKHWADVALILRQNVVQGKKVSKTDDKKSTSLQQEDKAQTATLEGEGSGRETEENGASDSASDLEGQTWSEYKVALFSWYCLLVVTACSFA